MSKDFRGHVSAPKSFLAFTRYLGLPTFSRLKCLTNLLQVTPSGFLHGHAALF